MMSATDPKACEGMSRRSFPVDEVLGERLIIFNSRGLSNRPRGLRGPQATGTP